MGQITLIRIFYISIVKTPWNKIFLLTLSATLAINSVIKYLPLIINKLVIFVLVISFTLEYRKMLRIFYIKFTNSLVFNSLLFIYAVISIVFDKILVEPLPVVWSVSIIVIVPILIMGLYGINYFKINSYELKLFYKQFLMSKNEYKEFWNEYNETHGIVNKIHKILIKAIPGILSGASIVFLIFPILVLSSTGYLFFILSLLLLIKEHLHRKKLPTTNGDPFQFLRYLINMKGMFGSLFLILGYLGWGILLISFLNLSLRFLYGTKVEIQFKILLLMLLSIFYVMPSYMFLYQYRLSKRFLKFIPLFYGDEKKITTVNYPSLPCGDDKIAALSLLFFLVLNYYLSHILLNEIKYGNNGILYLAISSIVVFLVSIFYIFLIFYTFKNDKMEYRIDDLKKDNLRIPFISTMPLIMICGIGVLSGGSDDIYGWLAVFYGLILVIFFFYLEDLYKKFRKWHINEYVIDFILFLVYFLLVGSFIFIPPIKKFYQIIIVAEVAILLTWTFNIILTYNKNN